MTIVRVNSCITFTTGARANPPAQYLLPRRPHPQAIGRRGRCLFKFARCLVLGHYTGLVRLSAERAEVKHLRQRAAPRASEASGGCEGTGADVVPRLTQALNSNAATWLTRATVAGATRCGPPVRDRRLPLARDLVRSVGDQVEQARARSPSRASLGGGGDR